MERMTRTHGHDSTSFKNDKKPNNPMRLADAPDDVFDYDPKVLGLSNDTSAPVQMKANLEEEQVQMKHKEPASAPRSAKASPGEETSSGRDELQMKPEEELQMKREDDEKKTQLKSENPTPHLGRTNAVQTKMPEAVQTKMQDSFGADFSNVNIHKGSASATNMGAQAYAQGNDIHFAPGKYNPNSQSGQELLGHELTHVVQQRQGRVQGTQNKVYPTKQSEGVGGANVNADSSLENEADVMGAKAAKGEPARVKGKGSGVQAQEKKDKIPTEAELDEIEKRYRAMVKSAKDKGYNVAADNLEHFLDGGGKQKTLSSSWLRSFSPITSAENVNHSRFEKSLIKEADSLKDGQSKSFSDYWDRGLYANAFTELYYASGGSSIKSIGSFKLSRSGNKVTITGSVSHHWYDPYDWHAELSAFVPGYGSISDADALKLQKYRGAKAYKMVSDWKHTLKGWVETNRWTDYFGTDFIWKKS